MKKVFNSKKKTITIEMSFEEYIRLGCAISYEANREEYTAYKDDFQKLSKEINGEYYKII